MVFFCAIVSCPRPRNAVYSSDANKIILRHCKVITMGGVMNQMTFANVNIINWVFAFKVVPAFN